MGGCFGEEGFLYNEPSRVTVLATSMLKLFTLTEDSHPDLVHWMKARKSNHAIERKMATVTLKDLQVAINKFCPP